MNWIKNIIVVVFIFELTMNFLWCTEPLCETKSKISLMTYGEFLKTPQSRLLIAEAEKAGWTEKILPSGVLHSKNYQAYVYHLATEALSRFGIQIQDVLNDGGYSVVFG